MIDLERTVSLLRDTQGVEILDHHFPDGDILGCAAALCRALQLMGKRTRCIYTDPVSEEYDFLFDEIGHQGFPVKSVISVDVADIKLLGPVLATKHAGKADLCIDHHDSHQDFMESSYMDNTTATACEIIYEVVCYLDVVSDRVTAQAVYTGIVTDTGCFRYSNTTARTHEVATQAIRTGIDTGGINRRMFETKTRTRLEMERGILDSIAFYFDTRYVVIYISRAMTEAPGADEGDLDGLSVIPRQIEGVFANVTMRERKVGSYRVSLCTQPQVNTVKIRVELGGGDHMAAAGCTIEENFGPACEKLLAAIGKIPETM